MPGANLKPRSIQALNLLCAAPLVPGRPARMLAPRKVVTFFVAICGTSSQHQSDEQRLLNPRLNRGPPIGFATLRRPLQWTQNVFFGRPCPVWGWSKGNRKKSTGLLPNCDKPKSTWGRASLLRKLASAKVDVTAPFAHLGTLRAHLAHARFDSRLQCRFGTFMAFCCCPVARRMLF